jgi:hypothetical protein
MTNESLPQMAVTWLNHATCAHCCQVGLVPSIDESCISPTVLLGLDGVESDDSPRTWQLTWIACLCWIVFETFRFIAASSALDLVPPTIHWAFVLRTGSRSGDFGMECLMLLLLRAREGMACFGTGFWGNFVLSAFESMSTALMNGLATLRLMKTCPWYGIRYSHLRSSRVHLEHAGCERSHCSRSQKRLIFGCRKDIATLIFMRLQRVQRPVLFGSPTIRANLLVVSSLVVTLCYIPISRLWVGFNSRLTVAYRRTL